jgi:protein CpxP
MKKLFLLLTLVLCIGLSANAQKIPTPDEIAKKNIEEMDKRLKLSATQRNVIYRYAFDMAKEQLALHKKQQAGEFRPEDETKMYRLMNDMNKNIKTRSNRRI